MNWIIILILMVSGATVSLQASINGILGKRVGVIEGSFISFLVGAIVLFFVMMFFGEGNIAAALAVPKWQLIGGILGAIYVTVMVLVVPKIGVGTALLTVILSQMLTSTVVDHFGLIGGKQIPADWKRILGLVLLTVALGLFYRK